MHDLRNPVDTEDMFHHFRRQQPRFAVADLNADDVAGVDIEHHVGVVVLAFDRPGQFCDVPRVHVPGLGGDQFGADPGLVAGLPAALVDLLVSGQGPIRRRH